MEVSEYEPGTFSWVDYAAADLDGAKAFYGNLFDWTLRQVPSDGGPYVIAEIDGKQVAGLMTLPDDTKQSRATSHWNSYVTVADADLAATKTQELGGTVLEDPFDVMDAGRMGVVTDPSGAAFCLWQAGHSIGAQLVNEPNTFCWNELYTHDVEATERFYTSLFGWRGQHATSSTGAKLVELYADDRPAATMMEIQPEWGSMPSVWGVYFAVGDCEAAVARARELGAEVALEPRDIPPGRFAVLQDPQGGAFSIIRLKHS